MNFPDAVRSGFENFINFQDRASRSEYWWWALFTFIMGVIAGLIDASVFGMANPFENGPVNSLTGLILLLPNLSMSVRRLHDIDRSGWWVLIVLTVIGIFVLIYWALQKGDDAINRFGPPPETFRQTRNF